MYELALWIQIISIVILLIETWVVFKNWRGEIHSYLFLACVSTLVNNVGYLARLSSFSEDACFDAIRLSYIGKVWTSFALFMFIIELVKIKLPTLIRSLLAVFSVITFIIVFTTRYTGLYYKSMSFGMAGQFPVLSHTNGVWHIIWDTVHILYILYGLTALVIAHQKENNPIAEKRLLMVILAVFTQSAFLVFQMFKLVPGTDVFDVTTLSFPIGAVFMLIAIFKYNLLDTEALAREYVVDELSEGIIAVNNENDLSYYNKPAISLFPELIKEPEKIINILRKAIDADEPIKHKDRIYSVEANRLGKGGVHAGVLYSLTDDTDHYRYMEQLEEQKRLADDANRAKSSFLANMSHEIRTPINAVLGMDEMILRESTEDDIISYAGDIRNAGRTLLSLINDILDFSKIEEGRMEILPIQYELASLVNDLVNMIRDRAVAKGLKFLVNVDPDTPYLLFGDEIRLKQVALNLLTNAVKYTNEGQVRLDIGFVRHENAEEEIGLTFKISDTGIGMKEEEMDKLFSPFSRMEEKRNRSIEGTGLGMSIVKQLLSLMDSDLNVKSVYGEGSEFSYEIRQKVISSEPIGDISDRFKAGTDERKHYHELFHAPDAHILAVDDTEVNLTVIKNMLKKTRVDIDTVLSGKEAVTRAGSKHYDVIFIDHMMPDMDGIETLEKLREETDSEGTAYIALTANAVSGARERYLAAGFDDYLSKPVDGKRLEELLRRYLPKDKLMSAADDMHSGRSMIRDHKDLKILVVDDDEVICSVAGQILGDTYKVITCNTADDAVELAAKEQPDLILLDINLGSKTGFDVLKELKRDANTCDIPVMFITADDDRDKEALSLKNGALDFVRKPFVPEVLRQRSKRIITLDRYQKNLQGEVLKQTDRAERLTMEMMVALSHTVDAKDHYTNGHSERVATYAAEIGRRMGKGPEEQKQLYEIGLLHDIGKIGVPEEIINKTERLTDEEFARIKEHTLIGHEILKGIEDMPELHKGARFHHERYDGRGYPDGLAGEDIPEVARIICVADCYDAMTSTRTYSDPKPQQLVREEIERCSGKQFDPDVARIMLSMIDDDKDFMMNEKGSGHTAWKGKEDIWDAGKVSRSYEVPAYDIQEEDMGEEEKELPSWLTLIPEIDTEQGVANCGSCGSYLSVLTTFHQTAKIKADEIEGMYKEGDIDNYTVKVHALKSSARIIGAAELSEMAKALEAAGKAGDLDTIGKDTGELLLKYRELDKKLKPLDIDKEELKDMSDDMRREAFRTVGEIAGSMDFGMMEGILKDLKAYRLSSEDEKVLKEMEDKLMGLDWDAIISLADKALGK